MKIGYARVSTRDQNTDLQVDALKAAGCDEVMIEKASGAKADRQVLMAVLGRLDAGDTVAVTKLDRLARSTQQLLTILADLEDRGVALQVLSGDIDTGTPAGRMLFTMLGAVAEFERDLIRERVVEGQKAARKRGVRFGRLNALTALQVHHALELVAGGASVREVAQTIGVGKTALYGALKGATDNVTRSA